MTLCSYIYERPARKHFRWWHNWAVRSRLQPMIEVARMLKRRFENIITYLRHRIVRGGEDRSQFRRVRSEPGGARWMLREQNSRRQWRRI
jgi:Transposase